METGGRYHRCHSDFDAQLFAHKLLTEGFKDAEVQETSRMKFFKKFMWKLNVLLKPALNMHKKSLLNFVNTACFNEHLAVRFSEYCQLLSQ